VTNIVSTPLLPFRRSLNWILLCQVLALLRWKKEACPGDQFSNFFGSCVLNITMFECRSMYTLLKSTFNQHVLDWYSCISIKTLWPYVSCHNQQIRVKLDHVLGLCVVFNMTIDTVWCTMLRIKLFCCVYRTCGLLQTSTSWSIPDMYLVNTCRHFHP